MVKMQVPLFTWAQRIPLIPTTKRCKTCWLLCVVLAWETKKRNIWTWLPHSSLTCPFFNPITTTALLSLPHPLAFLTLSPTVSNPPSVTSTLLCYSLLFKILDFDANFGFWWQVGFPLEKGQVGWCQRPLWMPWRPFRLIRSPTTTPLLLLTTMTASPIISARLFLWQFCVYWDGFAFNLYHLCVWFDDLSVWDYFCAERS